MKVFPISFWKNNQNGAQKNKIKSFRKERKQMKKKNKFREGFDFFEFEKKKLFKKWKPTPIPS